MVTTKPTLTCVCDGLPGLLFAVLHLDDDVVDLLLHPAKLSVQATLLGRQHRVGAEQPQSVNKSPNKLGPSYPFEPVSLTQRIGSIKLAGSGIRISKSIALNSYVLDNYMTRCLPDTPLIYLHR